MKYAKMLGLLAMAAAALMAFAGSASATELTSPKNTKLAVGEKIHATSEAATELDGSVTITCQKSTVEGEVTQAGGVATTVEGKLTALTFEECGTATVTVVAKGTLIVHTEYTTEANKEEKEKTTVTGNGTLTSTGAEITVQTHSFFLGTTHCIYKTNGTDIGTLTGSINTGGTATLDIGSAPIPQIPTDGLCGEDAEWTGNYKVNIPDYLDVD